MVNKEYRFKVIYGFEKTSVIKISTGAELEKAIYASVKQNPLVLGGKMIQGKHIISIEPDYHYYTGWYDHFQPEDGDDWQQIKRDCPPELESVLERYADRVRHLISTKQTELIGKGEPINELQLSSEAPESSPYAKQLLDDKSHG